MATISLLLGASLFIYLGLIVLVDMRLMLDGHDELKDLSSLAFVCMGWSGRFLIDFFILLSGVGSIMSYTVVIGELATKLLTSWGWLYASSFSGLCIVTSVIFVLFVLPLCLRRHFGHFTYISVISMMSVATVLLLIVVAGPLVTAQPMNPTDAVIVYTGMSSGAGTQLGSIIFALGCSYAVLPTFQCITPRYRTQQGWGDVSFWSVLIGFLALFTMGLSGYLVFRGTTDDIIISNFTGCRAVNDCYCIRTNSDYPFTLFSVLFHLLPTVMFPSSQDIMPIPSKSW